MWDMENKLNDDLSAFLPDLSGYELTDAILTTYSLDTEYLEGVLFSLKAIKLVKKDRVHVFYDKYSRSEGQGENQVISERFLHAIDWSVKGKSYSFHPKIILLRYKKEDKIRYVIFVMSRNLAESNLLDCYAVASGDVSEDKANGQHISDFFDSFSDSKFKGEEKYIFDELSRTTFITNNEKVKFMKADEVYSRLDEIKNDKGLVIVSPYLSKSFIDKFPNIRMLVSTRHGFSRLKILDKSLYEKCRLFSADRLELHAKIYAWKDEDEKKAHWIIGSSNATASGMLSNVEYNMEFCTDIGVFCKFLKLFENCTFNIDDIDFESDKTNTRKILCDILKSTDIKCKENNGEYECHISFSKKLEYEISACISGTGDYEFINGQKIILKSTKPFARINIKIVMERSDEEDEFSIHCISVYEKWNLNVKMKSMLDEQAKAAYIACVKIKVDALFRGDRVQNAFSDRSYDSSGEVDSNASVNKNYFYEKLMALSASCKDDNAYNSVLDEIKENAELIEESTYTELAEFIDEMKVK